MMTSRTLRFAAAAFALAVCPAFSQPPVPTGQGTVPGPGGRGQAGRGGPSITSPEILADHRVTFRIAAPKAAEVTIAGEWGDTGAPLAKDDKGIWSLTVGPLKPDLYCYSFTVDGAKTLDGQNPRYRRNGARFDSVVVVPGAGSSLYEIQEVPHGAISSVWYRSASLGLTRRMFVYTPPGYEEGGTTKYPAMYLLHGAGNDEETWLTTGRVHHILDNLIAQGKARPMVVAILNGNATQAASANLAAPGKPAAPAPTGGRDAGPGPGQGAPSGGGAGNTAFPESIVPDVVPYVESHYRVVADRGHRAIVGLSMGGAHALYAGLRHTDTFAWVAGFGGAYVTWPGAMASIPPQPGLSGPGSGQALKVEALDAIFPNLTGKGANLRLLYMSEGGDDALKIAGVQLKAWLEARSLTPTYVETPGSDTTTRTGVSAWWTCCRGCSRPADAAPGI